LRNQNTTHRRTIKTVTLTAALACALAAGVEITPSLARSHHPSGAALRHQSRTLTRLEQKVKTLTRAANAAPGSGLSGIASVYHDPITANGEHMNPNAMTAAHNTLPFGSRVTVFNRHNGRSATVRINDRGPYVRGRVIDLSPGAARVLGVDGLAPVSLKVASRRV
jgi:rare lipoprotein A